jgi:hypothetical protein
MISGLLKIDRLHPPIAALFDAMIPSGSAAISESGGRLLRLHTTKTAGLSHAREHGELYYGVA